jgi:hypothetical protein
MRRASRAGGMTPPVRADGGSGGLWTCITIVSIAVRPSKTVVPVSSQ